jgi:hypothetical protein
MTGLPQVTAADALDDFAWFDRLANRKFRVRRTANLVWIIRRRGQVFLRTVTHHLPVATVDTDAATAPLWFAAAYPDISLQKAQRRARTAIKRRAA